MKRDEQNGLTAGRELLEHAAERYERPLSAEEYWWLGVGLAASTLAEMAEKDYAVARIEQLMERLGYHGIESDWFQRFVEELATLNAEGLLWPAYERNGTGPMEPTGLQIHPSFDGRASYSLALAHLGVAIALNHEESETVQLLAGVIAEMVESGLQPAHEPAIMTALDRFQEPAEGDDSPAD